jgi:hypothetical protein
MLNRGASRIISLALVLALFGVAAIYSAEAQDPPRPPEPKRPPQQQDARERKSSQRQGAQADELGTPGEDRIKIDTELQIERAFGGGDQDIEWITIGNQIYIVQSRPYVEK